jgi:hypothetical protein
MSRLRELIESTIPQLEKKKPMLEATPEVEKKVAKMADLFLKTVEVKNALIDSFTDWFESKGKKLVGLADTDYSLDDMDVLMGIAIKEFEKRLK